MLKKKAADFRLQARTGLKGNWGIAILAGFVTAIFCGSSVSVNFDQDTLKQLYGDNVTDKINQFFSQTPYALPLAIIFLVWAVVVLILGGAVRLGSSRFYTDLVQKKQLSLNTVFSYFNN